MPRSTPGSAAARRSPPCRPRGRRAIASRRWPRCRTTSSMSLSYTVRRRRAGNASPSTTSTAWTRRSSGSFRHPEWIWRGRPLSLAAAELASAEPPIPRGPPPGAAQPGGRDERIRRALWFVADGFASFPAGEVQQHSAPWSVLVVAFSTGRLRPRLTLPPPTRDSPCFGQRAAIPGLDDPVRDRHFGRQQDLACADRGAKIVAAVPARLGDFCVVDAERHDPGAPIGFRAGSRARAAIDDPRGKAQHETLRQRPGLAAQVAELTDGDADLLRHLAGHRLLR